MADSKLTALTANTAPASTDILYIVDDPGGSPLSQKITWANLLGANLVAIYGLTSAANKVPYFTGSGTAAVADFSSFGRSLVDDADAAAGRTTLGLGTIATQDANNVSITGGSISGVTTLSVTGSANATVGINVNSAGVIGYSGNQVRWGLASSWFQQAWYTDSVLRMLLDINGQLGIGTSSPSAHLHTLESDAATNSVVEHVIHGLRSTGTAAAGFGLSVKRQLESSTTNDVDASRNVTLWNVATHASRTVDVVQYATDYGGEREIWRGRANGSAAAVGFLGATPVARASHIADPSGGGTQDSEARTAINAVLVVLENLGFIATS